MWRRYFALLALTFCLWVFTLSAAPAEEFAEGMSLQPYSELIANGEASVTELKRLGYLDGPRRIRITPPPAISDFGSSWLLHIPYYYRNDLQVFIGGERRWHTGNLHPLNSRAINDPEYVFPITAADQGQVIEVRLESEQSMNLPLRAWTAEGFQEHSRWRDLVHFGYGGAMAMLIVIHLIVGLVLRNLNFLLYAGLTACVATVVMTFNGYMRLFVWPEAIVWDQAAEQLLSAGFAVFALLLGKRFLPLGGGYRWLDHFMHLMLAVSIGVALVTLYGVLVEDRLINLYGIGIVVLWVITIVLIVRSAIALREGNRSARFLVVGWSILWLGISISAAWGSGLLPSYLWVVHGTQIGSVFEAVFLSLALADQLLRERRSLGQAEAAVTAAEASRQKQVRLTQLVSHEFRNPLGIIQNQLTLLTRAGVMDDPAVARRLRSIEAASARLTSLVKQWFSTNRVLDQRLAGQYKTIHLATWLNAQQAYLRSCFPDHDLSFVIADEPGVFGEPDLLETALFNLVENACKYSPPGSMVSIRLEQRGGHAILKVSDQGCGIDPEEQVNIFEDFYRQQRAGDPYGLGLGLSLVRDVVGKHQGWVRVQSVPLGGAEFVVTLPLTDQP